MNEPNGDMKPAESTNILSALTPDSLYILLYWQRDMAVRFHWGLYHHLGTADGGYKFDIIRPDGIWAPNVPYNGAPRADVIDPDPTEPLACAVRVGVIGRHVRKAHDLIRAEDDRLNELNFELDGTLSCRVYVRRACERLQETQLLHPLTWIDLENEILEIGNQNEDHRGEGPFIVNSNVANVRE